ncbi:MAG: TetR/AcrR family transcriptional regulator [Myxococcota bacterium]|nr:TetR/AcrR family transcriptional regulator [Myxococcota bacterium]
MISADGSGEATKYIREPDEAPPRDGRAARALRTRQAVADALLRLLEEGELRPTSRMIAEKAGVSERTIFQHFEDLETLFCVSASRLGDRVFRNLDFISSDGPFEQRLKAYLDELVYLHETVSPVRKASRLHESFSPVLDRSLRSWREALRKGIDLVFVGVLRRLPEDKRPAVREGLALIATWSSWENMRTHSGLSLEEARSVLEVNFRLMLGHDGPASTPS